MDNIEIIEGDNLETISLALDNETGIVKASMNTNTVDGVVTKGIVRIRKTENGVTTDVAAGRNLVVNGGRAALMYELVNGGATKQVVNAGWGEGTSTPVGTNTSLTNEYQNAIAGASNPAATWAQFELELGVTEGNGMAISELGLYCADGTLFSRFVWGGVINKTSAMSISATWIIQD